MSFDYTNPLYIVIAVAVLLIVAICLVLYLQHLKRTSLKLRNRFGSEYERELLEHNSVRKAEASLNSREARVEKLKIRELVPAQRDRFVADWATVESRFLDHPRGSVTEADELVTSLLQARGYPVSGFEQSAEDVSVNYPRMMERYRSAHSIAARRGQAEPTTEELRSALIDYRSLFDELAQVGPALESRVRL